MSRIETRLEDLKERQKNGTYTLCPRCGLPTMKKDLYTNALSRAADIMVCDSCGMDEAKLAFMGAPESLYQWSALQPVRPEGNFKDATAKEAWKRICKEQADTINDLYYRYTEGKADDAETRYNAFESCPGLTQIWTEPFHMRYACKDATLVISVREFGSELEMRASLVDGK